MRPSTPEYQAEVLALAEQRRQARSLSRAPLLRLEIGPQNEPRLLLRDDLEPGVALDVLVRAQTILENQIGHILREERP